MKLSRSLHANVNSTNNIRVSSADDMPAKTSILHSISLVEIAQEESNSLISKETRFSTDSNEIHDNQHHRDVYLKTAETFLMSPNHNRNKTENDHTDPIKYKAANIETASISQGIYWLAKGVIDFTKTVIMPLYENRFDGFDWKPTLENTVTTFGSMYCPMFSEACFLKKVGVCGIILNLISSTEAKPVTNIINIDSVDTLQMIGNHAEFPSSGHYILTSDIDARNMTQPLKGFYGTFDGKGHVISHLSCCLMRYIAGDAVIKDLILSDANTGDYLPCVATLAGRLKGNAKVSFLQVRDSEIKTTRGGQYLGLVVQVMFDSARIENTIVYSSSITSEHFHTHCGGVTGVMTGQTESRNNTIHHCNITTFKGSSIAGGITGAAADNSMSNQDSVSQINIVTHGNRSPAALAVGNVMEYAVIKGTTLTDSRVATFGSFSDAGLAVGTVFKGPSIKIFNIVAVRCDATATGEDSSANPWIGNWKNSAHVQISNNTAINCTYSDKQPVTQPVTTTIAEPVVADEVSLLPILLYGGGAVVCITAAGLVSYSLYCGYKEGNSGWDLAKYPVQSCVKWFTDFYQSLSTSHPLQSEEIEMEEGEFDTEHDEMNLLPSISILGSDNIVVLEEHQLL